MNPEPDFVFLNNGTLGSGTESKPRYLKKMLLEKKCEYNSSGVG
jgi:hypothetical protein